MGKENWLSVRISGELKRELMRRAEAESRNLSNYINVILQQHCKEQSEKKLDDPANRDTM